MDIDWEKLPPMMSGARAKKALGYRPTNFQAVLHEKQTLGFTLIDGLNVSIKRSELRAHFENPNQPAAERGWQYPGKAVREKAKRPEPAPVEAPAAMPATAQAQATSPAAPRSFEALCIAHGVGPDDTEGKRRVMAIMNRMDAEELAGVVDPADAAAAWAARQG